MNSMFRGLKLFKALGKNSFAQAYATLPPELVIFMDNNDMIVCWHPEQPFPYEYSRPIPPKNPEDKSVLKVGSKDIKEVFHKVNNELVPQELAALTYTTKHRWYPRAREKRWNKDTPMNRRYL